MEIAILKYIPFVEQVYTFREGATSKEMLNFSGKAGPFHNGFSFGIAADLLESLIIL